MLLKISHDLLSEHQLAICPRCSDRKVGYASCTKVIPQRAFLERLKHIRFYRFVISKVLLGRLCSFVSEGTRTVFEAKKAFKYVYALPKEFLSLHKHCDGWRRLFSELPEAEIQRRKLKYLKSYAETR